MKFKSFTIVWWLKLKFWQENFCIKILFGNYYFIPPNNLMRKGKDLDLYLWQTDPDADQGGKKPDP